MMPISTLPKSEIEVAKIVWKLKRATVTNVTELLLESREINSRTVQTYLRRLEDKGYLAVDRSGRSNIYTPLIEPSRVIRESVSTFVSQLFDGKALSLIQYLVQHKNLFSLEILEVRVLLNEIEATDVE